MTGWAPREPQKPNQRALLPDRNITTAIASIHQLNDDPAVAPAGTDRACFRRPYSDCSKRAQRLRPQRGALGEGVVAITRRQPEIAVALLRRLDDTCSNVLLSPWLSPALFAATTGETRASEGAALTHGVDWSVLAPLEGFAIDLSTGQCAVSPQIPGNWRSIDAPVFSPTFWGRLEFHPTARGGVTVLRIDRLIALPASTPGGSPGGSSGLTISRLRIPGPPPRPVGAPAVETPVAHVSRGTTPLGVKSIRDRSGDLHPNLRDTGQTERRRPSRNRPALNFDPDRERSCLVED